MRVTTRVIRVFAAAGLLATTAALADGPIQLTDFYYELNTPVLDMLAIVAPPEAAGQQCMVFEILRGGVQMPVANIVLLPGLNLVPAVDVGAQSYLATGPQIQPKFINPGSN